MREKAELLNVCKEFFNINNIREIKELTTGNINETYIIVFDDYKYVLQQLNSHVYYSPIGVMNNTRLIVDHIRKKCIYEGKNPHRSVLNFIKTRFNQDLAIVNNEYWRCSEFIDNAYSLERNISSMEFYEIGKAIGKFQYLLSDFTPNVLDDSIRNFHDTVYRFERFKEVIELDKYNRVKECLPEICFIFKRSKNFNIITDKLEKGIIPKRVSHNDTKASNIMLDKKSKKYLCLIDLDTVMQGSLLYDYGDALRYGASICSEEETDISKINIDLNLFRAFTRGFLEELKPLNSMENNKTAITCEEIELLYEGFWIITIELGMRFLHDYLDGDKYFRKDENRIKHNLERARNQLQLVLKLEEKENDMKKIIDELLIELEYLNKNSVKS